MTDGYSIVADEEEEEEEEEEKEEEEGRKASGRTEHKNQEWREGLTQQGRRKNETHTPTTDSATLCTYMMF